MKFFESVFEYSYASAISVEAFLMCLGTALGLGQASDTLLDDAAIL